MAYADWSFCSTYNVFSFSGIWFILFYGMTPLRGGHLAYPEGLFPLTTAWTDRLVAKWFGEFL
jgi:hypothetical protein